MSNVKLIVTFENGKRYEIDASIIAKHRADYFAKKHPEEGPYQTVFRKEYKFALSDDYELTDWASNNMNWSDVQAHAKELPPIEGEGLDWTNADKEIVRD